MVSVSYRFLIAAFIMFLYLLLRGKLKDVFKLSLKSHFFLFMQGVTLCGINFWLFYRSEFYITSGITAFISSTLVFMNLFLGSLFLRKKLEKRLFVTGVLGFLGMGVIFLSELTDFRLEGIKLFGLMLALLATLVDSFGNIVSVYNQRRGLPVSLINAFGMLYGALFLLLLSILTGRELLVDVSLKYIGSLLFLSVFASVIAFAAYLLLIQRIGVERSAYIAFLYPLIALVMSSIFEGYTWSIISLLGILLILLSKFLVLRIKQEGDIIPAAVHESEVPR